MKRFARRMCATCLAWVVPFPVAHAADGENYELVFSTYVGGTSWEHARDVCTDGDGNIYVVGGTASQDFPTTPGAYDRAFHSDGKEIGAAGLCDAFIMKFSPNGKLIWSTLLVLQRPLSVSGMTYGKGIGLNAKET